MVQLVFHEELMNIATMLLSKRLLYNCNGDFNFGAIIVGLVLSINARK